jgi:protein CpxP
MKALLNRRHLAATVLGTAISALSFTAIAQNTVTPQAAPAAPAATAAPHQAKEPGQRHGPQAQAERQKRFEQSQAERQSRLKDSLQLRADQDPAWKDFIAQTQPKPRVKTERLSREQWAQMNTPQRLDRFEALKAERDAQFKQRNDGIRRFYSQLSPSQQKAFDAQRGMGMGMGEQHMGHRGHKGDKAHMGQEQHRGFRAQRG